MKNKWFEICRDKAGEDAGSGEAVEAEAAAETASEAAAEETAGQEEAQASSNGFDSALEGFNATDWDGSDAEEPEVKAEEKKSEEPSDEDKEKAAAEAKAAEDAEKAKAIDEERKAAEDKAKADEEAAAEAKAQEEKAKTEEPKKKEGREAQVAQTLSQSIAENESKIVEELSKLYEIPDDDIDAFDTDPEARKKVLVGLAAKLHFNVVKAAAQIMEQHVPQIIQQQGVAKSNEQAIEEKFLGDFPDLGKESLPKFWEFARLMAAQNPETKTDEVIQVIGTMMTAQAGKTPSAAKPAPKPKSQPAFSPAAASAPPSSEPAKPKSGTMESQLIGFEALDED